MLDTGAVPNLVKLKCVRDPKLIDKQDTITLSGMTPANIPTHGSMQAHYLGHALKFFVVYDDFPTRTDGILGAKFFMITLPWISLIRLFDGANFSINNDIVLTLPPRSRTILSVVVKNAEISERYLPRMTDINGVFVGESLVTNRGGIAYVGCVNTNGAQ